MNPRSIRSLFTFLLISVMLLVGLPTGADAAGKKKKKDPLELRAVKSDVK